MGKEAADALPKHSSYDHEIPLKEGGKPRWGPIYPLSEVELETLREYLKEMMRTGKIRRSSSSAGAPILFVPKPHGRNLRLCVDYRGINRITIPNRYPLPLMQELQDRIQGAQYFTKIDLKNGYHLVRMKEGEEWTTACADSVLAMVSAIIRARRSSGFSSACRVSPGVLDAVGALLQVAEAGQPERRTLPSYLQAAPADMAPRRIRPPAIPTEEVEPPQEQPTASRTPGDTRQAEENPDERLARIIAETIANTLSAQATRTTNPSASTGLPAPRVARLKLENPAKFDGKPKTPCCAHANSFSSSSARKPIPSLWLQRRASAYQFLSFFSAQKRITICTLCLREFTHVCTSQSQGECGPRPRACSSWPVPTARYGAAANLVVPIASMGHTVTPERTTHGDS